MVSQEQKVSSAFDWNVIENHGFSTLSFSETLAGGQSFVWEQDKSGTWNGVISNAVISLRLDNELLKWKSSEQSFGKTELMNYLWLGPSYSIAIDTLPWRSDPILERPIKLLSGLRILRQPVGETLFYFLLSPVKSIPQIREIGSKVAKLLGPTLALSLIHI